MRPPLALVTGASGFIGSHLTKRLLKEGKWRVRATLRGAITPSRERTIRNALGAQSMMLEFAEVDLNVQEGWREAVRDCQYVFHLASPTNLSVSSKNSDHQQSTAVNGTMNVLNTCLESDSVKRVILTGSAACIAYTDDIRCHNEDDWTSPDTNTPPYVRGKIKAERLAWEMVPPSRSQLELAVINPGLVVGPRLLPVHNTGSFQILKLILNGDMPLIPNIPFSLIHVDDVVSAHIAAARIQEATGHRHIVTDKFLSLLDIAKIIRKEFEPLGRKVSTIKLPKFMTWLLKSVGNQDAKYMYPIIDKRITFDNRRMRDVLKVKPSRDVTEGIIESCCSILDESAYSLGTSEGYSSVQNQKYQSSVHVH